mmetsp:Transcript_2920/g.10078  ORF Transcript_2920/g.10078 Transcript_2920/m.10078 type:complete len:375 (+) Transcript_2920:6-1130(+)
MRLSFIIAYYAKRLVARRLAVRDKLLYLPGGRCVGGAAISMPVLSGERWRGNPPPSPPLGRPFIEDFPPPPPRHPGGARCAARPRGLALLPLLGRGGAPLAGGHAGRGHGPVAGGGRGGGRGLAAPVGAGRLRLIPVRRRRRHVHLEGGDLARGRLLLCLRLDLLGVAVEEEVDHDVPGLGAVDGAAQAEHLARQHPVEQPDRVLALVVCRDGDVDVLQRRVGVAEGDGGDVGVGGLGDGLVVGARVRQEQQPRLHELVRDLVGEGARREAAGDRRRARVLAVLEDGALAVGAGRDDAHVGGVLDRDDDARRELQLVVRAAEVDDVDPVRLALPHVARHLVVQVLGAEVGRARKHHLEVLLLLLLADVVHRHGC